jgi:hypothetical protein
MKFVYPVSSKQGSVVYQVIKNWLLEHLDRKSDSYSTNVYQACKTPSVLHTQQCQTLNIHRQKGQDVATLTQKGILPGITMLLKENKTISPSIFAVRNQFVPALVGESICRRADTDSSKRKQAPTHRAEDPGGIEFPASEESLVVIKDVCLTINH